MKKMVTDTMLAPTYATRFACIGGDCEDTCCAGWGINLDKDSFLHYQSCQDPVIRPLVTQYVHRNPHSKSTGDLGHIKLRQDACRACPFLNEKQLCIIYERLGEKSLSNTCTYYPRTINRIGDLHQLTMTLSCPEVARLALLHEDAFDLVGQWQEVRQDFVIQVMPKLGLSVEAMDEVRTLLYQVLQSQDISLSDRLKVIGLFCERLSVLLQSKKVDALPELLADFEAELENGTAMATVSGSGELLDVQAQIAAVFFAVGWKTFHSPHATAVLHDIAQGLGLREETFPDSAELEKTYLEGLERLKPALAEVPWLMEHYLLNEALREFFPWSYENPWQHYKFLVMRFAVTRLMLAGRALTQEAPLTPEALAETVQVACRRYVHDTKICQQLEKVLAERGHDGLEMFLSLI